MDEPKAKIYPCGLNGERHPGDVEVSLPDSPEEIWVFPAMTPKLLRSNEELAKARHWLSENDKKEQEKSIRAIQLFKRWQELEKQRDRANETGLLESEERLNSLMQKVYDEYLRLGSQSSQLENQEYEDQLCTFVFEALQARHQSLTKEDFERRFTVDDIAEIYVLGYLRKKKANPTLAQTILGASLLASHLGEISKAESEPNSNADLEQNSPIEELTKKY